MHTELRSSSFFLAAEFCLYSLSSCPSEKPLSEIRAQELSPVTTPERRTRSSFRCELRAHLITPKRPIGLVVGAGGTRAPSGRSPVSCQPDTLKAIASVWRADSGERLATRVRGGGQTADL